MRNGPEGRAVRVPCRTWHRAQSDLLSGPGGCAATPLLSRWEPSCSSRRHVATVGRLVRPRRSPEPPKSLIQIVPLDVQH